MGRSFNLARTPSGTPNTQSIVATAAQAFKKGALVVDTAAGTVSECGADPVSVLGVAMSGAFAGLGYDMANAPAVVTGRSAESVIAIADRSQIFLAVVLTERPIPLHHCRRTSVKCTELQRLVQKIGFLIWRKSQRLFVKLLILTLTIRFSLSSSVKLFSPFHRQEIN